jgi:hypothetical protein
MSRPSKAQLKERKRQERTERRALRAVTYDPDSPDHGWIVCDACGFVQPHGVSETCLRGRVLSGPGEKGRHIDLTCDSIYSHTVESFEEEAA